MSVTKENLREANRKLEAELEKQNQENERLKEQIMERAAEEVKEAISTEEKELLSEMSGHLQSAKAAEEKIWEAKREVETAAGDLKGAIGSSMALAAMNWWIVFPVGLLAGIVGQAAGKVLIEGTSWTAMEVLIGAGALAAGVPLLVGLWRVVK